MEIELRTTNPEQCSEQSPERPSETQTKSEAEVKPRQEKKSSKSGLASIDFGNIKWTWKDVHLSILMTLITFGDAVEIYLPGVITQSASAELGVSKTQEGILGIILYLSLAVSYFILPAVKNMIGRRVALLASLYISIIATVICSLVPNYYTLIISRALLGFCIGLNMAVAGVYFAEEISSYDMYNLGNFAGLFAFTLGGGWAAVLGYILLGKIGWRYFIICASVPIFLPPIFILHFVLKEPERRTNQAEVQAEKEVINVAGYWIRLVKGCVANFINTLQGWGSILLIPALLTYLNNSEISLSEDQQLLVLALLYGVAKLIGRILSIFLLKYIRFRILQTLLSVIIALCYLILIFIDNNLIVTVLAMGIANMAFCVTRCELTLMEYDKYFFGTEKLVLAASVMAGSGMTGATVGAIAAQFLSTPNAVIFTFVLSCVQVVAFVSITER